MFSYWRMKQTTHLWVHRENLNVLAGDFLLVLWMVFMDPVQSG